MLAADLVGESRCEELRERMDSRFGGPPGDIAGGVDAENPAAALLEAAQQGPVVAADIDHETGGRQVEPGAGGLGHVVKVQQERSRVPALVGVVVEQVGWIDYVQDLDMTTVEAEVQVQREHRCGKVQFLPWDILLRHRRWSEGYHSFETLALAEAAASSAGHGDGSHGSGAERSTASEVK